MRKYIVTIAEELSMDVEVDADSAAEAAEKAQEAWKNDKYVLTADDFKEVHFDAQEKDWEE